MIGSVSPVVAVRPVGGPDRSVHLVALPTAERLSVVSALCGALMLPGRVQAVGVGTGVPCSLCLIHRVAEQPVTMPGELAPGGPMAVTKRATPQGYAALGWPITVREDQVLLEVGTELIALVMPIALAEGVAVLLAARERPVPVLAHPHAPEHRIVLAAEPYGVQLPWPTGVHAVTGHLPLPPTVTPEGAITWIHLPDGHALTFGREIDLAGALRTLTQPTPPRTPGAQLGSQSRSEGGLESQLGSQSRSRRSDYRE